MLPSEFVRLGNGKYAFVLILLFPFSAPDITIAAIVPHH